MTFIKSSVKLSLELEMEENNMIIIGDRIKSARQFNDLNQKELADKLGVGRTAVSNYEQNHVFPTALGLIKLCKVLNVWPEYILGLSPYMNQEQLEDALYSKGKFSVESNDLATEVEKLQILLENNKLKFLDEEIPEDKRKLAVLQLENLLELLRL